MDGRGQVGYACPFCGQVLKQSGGEAVCAYCGDLAAGDWVCPQGHYICETCRLASPRELIAIACGRSGSTNPREIADLIMRHPNWHDHGPAHHLLVAPVLLTALGNAGRLPGAADLLSAALKRSDGIPLGACASRGDCGACTGAAAALALLLKATYGSGRERNLVLKTLATGLLLLAGQGEGRCCKQSVYAGLEAAGQILSAEMGIRLALQPQPCVFAARIPDCRGESCRYHEPVR
jgi:hypothetical protein